LTFVGINLVLFLSVVAVFCGAVLGIICRAFAGVFVLFCFC